MVTKDGEVVMTLGAAGGLRILSGIVQVISRTIDRGMDLEAAVAAPRVHPSQGTDPDTGGRTFDRMSFSAEFTLKMDGHLLILHFGQCRVQSSSY